MTQTWTKASVLAAMLTLASSCGERKDEGAAKPAADDAAPVAAAPADAAPPAPVESKPVTFDGQCPMLSEVEAGGELGDKSWADKRKRHAGIKRVHLRSGPSGELFLGALGVDDAENELGLPVSQISPQRAAQVYRFREGKWQDLGRPFRFVGWDIDFDEVLASDDPAFSLTAGIGDVRRSLVARCDAGRWSMTPRYDSRKIDAISLVDTPSGAKNVYRLKGPITELGESCKLDTHLGGGLLPVAIEFPPPFASGAEPERVSLEDGGDCRLGRKFDTASNGHSLVTVYERCSSQNGGDHVAIMGCGLKGLWFDHQRSTWVSLPGLEKLGGYEFEGRHQVALGAKGPVLAVSHDVGFAVYELVEDQWQPLPALPKSKGCLLPVDIQADPVRVVTRSCSGYGKLRASYFDGERWQEASRTPLTLKPAYKAQQRPDTSVAWLGTTPYIAIGYYGAPVVRVYQASGKGWSTHLQAFVDAVSP